MVTEWVGGMPFSIFYIAFVIIVCILILIYRLTAAASANFANYWAITIIIFNYAVYILLKIINGLEV